MFYVSKVSVLRTPQRLPETADVVPAPGITDAESGKELSSSLSVQSWIPLQFVQRDARWVQWMPQKLGTE